MKIQIEIKWSESNNGEWFIRLNDCLMAIEKHRDTAIMKAVVYCAKQFEDNLVSLPDLDDIQLPDTKSLNSGG